MRRWWNGWLETRSFSGRGESLWAAGRKGDFPMMIPREVQVVFEDYHTRASGSLDSRLRGNDGKCGVLGRLCWKDAAGAKPSRPRSDQRDLVCYHLIPMASGYECTGESP